MKRHGRVAGALACLLGIAIMSSGAAVAQDTSPTLTDSLTASPEVPSVSVIDVYPMDIGAGPVADDEFFIIRGEVTGDIAWFFVAPDPYVETVLEHLPG